MALITCPECAAQISDKAVVCPQCGHPMGNTKRNAWQPFGIGWMALAVIAFVLALFALLDTCTWKQV